MSADNYGVVKRFGDKYYYGMFFGEEDGMEAERERYREGPFGNPVAAYAHAIASEYFEYGVQFHQNCGMPGADSQEDDKKPVEQVLPCNEPCPKCGSKDIALRHHIPGDDPNPSGSSDKKRSSAFIDRTDRWRHKVLVECLSHHCRTCQYYWDTACLPAPKEPNE